MAKRELNSLVWARVKEDDTIASYDSYLASENAVYAESAKSRRNYLARRQEEEEREEEERRRVEAANAARQAMLGELAPHVDAIRSKMKTHWFTVQKAYSYGDFMFFHADGKYDEWKEAEFIRSELTTDGDSIRVYNAQFTAGIVGVTLEKQFGNWTLVQVRPK